MFHYKTIEASIQNDDSNRNYFLNMKINKYK